MLLVNIAIDKAVAFAVDDPVAKWKAAGPFKLATAAPASICFDRYLLKCVPGEAIEVDSGCEFKADFKPGSASPLHTFLLKSHPGNTPKNVASSYSIKANSL